MNVGQLWDTSTRKIARACCYYESIKCAFSLNTQVNHAVIRLESYQQHMIHMIHPSELQMINPGINKLHISKTKSEMKEDE